MTKVSLLKIKDAIAAGSTLATAQHLHNVLGNDFHGNDIVQINKVIPEGKRQLTTLTLILSIQMTHMILKFRK